MKVRKHIYFSGMVQGVGFRYRAMYAARELGLTGWVTNLWDGRVEMEVQGDETAIRRLITLCEKGHFIHITKVDMTDLPLDPHESSFRVEGY
jgi:acylphosphatase